MADRPILASITEQEKSDGKVMAILAYLGILVFIPMMTSKENKFVMFHVEQGLILLIVEVVGYIILSILMAILSSIVESLACGVGIINLIFWIVCIVFFIMGLLNAIGGKVKELPVIGSYGAKLNLVK